MRLGYGLIHIPPCGRERVGALTIGITSSRNTTFPVSCPLFSGSSLRLFDFRAIVRYQTQTQGDYVSKFNELGNILCHRSVFLRYQAETLVEHHGVFGWFYWLKWHFTWLRVTLYSKENTIPKWKSKATFTAMHSCSHLSKLPFTTMHKCSNLSKLPVTAMHRCSSLSKLSFTTMHKCSSLSKLPFTAMHSCSNLSKLPFTAMHSCSNPSKLPFTAMHSCSNLSKLPFTAMHKCSSLSKLQFTAMHSCSNLSKLQFTVMHKCSSLSKLQFTAMHNCSNLSKLPFTAMHSCLNLSKLLPQNFYSWKAQVSHFHLYATPPWGHLPGVLDVFNN